MKLKKYKELLLLAFLSLIINFSTINHYPVLDRDEARYAQSTKQMIETNNYKSIKFQEELRSKKPIGIYWLQAISVNFFSNLGIDSNSNYQLNKIWKYRFVASLFSFFSCLALYLIATKVFSKRRAFFASIILNCTLLFAIEAHTAKTDSVLLTFSIISMTLLCGYYKGIFSKKIDIHFFLLWISIGFSILIKGPILVFIILLSITFISLFKRKLRWVLNTNPFLGLFVLMIIIMPWFLSISGAEQSSFVNQGLKKDLLDKILGVQESHGAFFGAHTLSIIMLFFPMSLFLFPSVLKMFKEFKSDDNFFLMAWILPNLFTLEIIPTKLPHYSLPLYPALALLLAKYINTKDLSQNKNLKSNINIIFSNLVYMLSVSILIYIFLFCIKEYSSTITLGKQMVFALIFLNLMAILINLRFSKIKSFYYQIFISCISFLFIFSFLLPNLDRIWISNNIYETVKKDNVNFYNENIAAIGFNEPSLIFMLGTNTKILSALREDFFEKKLYKYIIVEKKYLNDFNNLLKSNKYNYELLNEFNGFNIAKNKWVSTLVFKLK